MAKKKYYALVTDGTVADLYIYGDIVSSKQTESDVSSYSLTQELQQVTANEITVHINSYGGEVSEALAIYNTLKRLDATVNTIVDGFACSAATIVFMAGQTRTMSRVGNFLVHPAWALTQGDAESHRRAADNLDTITEQSITVYMDYITKSREELEALMQEERFLTPEEVLDWGFATTLDEDVETSDDEEETTDEETDIDTIEVADESMQAAASVRRLVHRTLIRQTQPAKPQAKKPEKDYMNTFVSAISKR